MTDQVSDLLFFAEVAKAGSITAAARRLDVPKSTISRRLIQLEERVGSKLFYKTTRKMTLTDLGEECLERCQRIGHEVDQARAFFEAVAKNPRGALRITMPTDVGIYWFADFLVQFTRDHPGLSLDLDFSPRRVDLVGERYDVAIRGGTLPSSSLVARRFLSIEWALYASPAYLAAAGIPAKPEDLADHRFVLLEAHSHPPELTLQNGRSVRTVEIDGAITSNAAGMVRALVCADGGIGQLPSRMCAADLEQGRLVRVLSDWGRPPIHVYYLVPARDLLPAKTRLFVEALNRHFSRKRD